jgi:hypothetical protein
VILTTPLALLGLLAIPAIVAIHLFRRRFPVQRVAGLFLWRAVAPTPEGGGRITRLPITTSLLLELLAALALTLIAAGARCAPSGTIDHLVILLDDSASMSARTSAGEMVRDRAARRAVQEVDRLGAGGRVTLVLSGERPTVIAGPAARPSEARDALQTWTPDAPHHSLGMGLRLARELAGDTGRLLVVSDEPPEDGSADGVRWVAVGERLPNIAITAAHRTLSPEQGRASVLLTLVNHADAAARRRLSISAGAKEVLARDLDVPPGTSSVTLPLPPGLPPVRVSLAGDALVRDNEVTLAEPRPRIVGVANRLAEGRGREALDRALDAIAGVTRSQSTHLAFVDGSHADASAPGAWRVIFGRELAASTAAKDSDFVGPFVLEKRHPLLQGVTLNGVIWTGASAQPAAPGSTIASVGDRAIITVAGGDIRFNLDLERTNLIRAPDWPILVSNIVERRREELPGPERWNYRQGEWVRLRLGREPAGALRYRLGNVERELTPGRVLEFVAPSPGGLLQILEGETVLYELGVNFLDEREADLRAKRSADVGDLVPGAGVRMETSAAEDPLFWILLAIASAALLGNWALLSPRPARRSPGVDGRVRA